MKGLGGSVDGADMVSTVGAAALLTAHSALLSQLLRSAVELLPSKALLENDEATCELLESLCSPQPPPEDWQAYGQVLQDRGVLDAIYRTLRSSSERPRVLAYSANALARLAQRDEIIKVNLYALPNLINVLLELLDKYSRDTTTVSALVLLLLQVHEVAGWHGAEKLRKLMAAMFSLIDGGFVYKEDDKKHVGPMWQLSWAVVLKLAERCVEYSYRDDDVDREWAERVLAIIDKNYKHWECVYALAFFSEPFGHAVLRPIIDRAAAVFVKLVRHHAKGGLGCQGRLCSDRVYEEAESHAKLQERLRGLSDEERRTEEIRAQREHQREAMLRRKRSKHQPHQHELAKRNADWGHTMDAALDLLIALLFVDTKDDAAAASRFQSVMAASLAQIDKYLIPNPDADPALAAGALDGAVAASYNRTGVVAMLVEVLASHMHRKTLVYKACNLLFFIAFDNKDFPIAELYHNGVGLTMLLQGLEQDLDDKSIECLEQHCTRFAACIILLARKSEYKEAVLGGWRVLMLLLDKAFELGLQVMVYLQQGHAEVKRRMREEFDVATHVLAHAQHEPWKENPIALKQVVDLLVGLKSPLVNQLPRFIAPAMLVVMAYYWTPRTVGRQLIFDPNPEDTLRVVTHILRNLQVWIQAQWASAGDVSASVPPALLELLHKGLSTTVVTLLWALPNDSPVWKAAVHCAYHLFRLSEQNAEERLAEDWIARRKNAPFVPATLAVYKEYLSHPNFDQGLWSFMESLFLPCFSKRGLSFSKEIIAPPAIAPAFQREFGGVKRPLAAKPQGSYVEGDPTQKRCDYCHRAGVALMRCGRCKSAFFCDRTCQQRGWPDHKSKCK